MARRITGMHDALMRFTQTADRFLLLCAFRRESVALTLTCRASPVPEVGVSRYAISSEHFCSSVTPLVLPNETQR